MHRSEPLELAPPLGPDVNRIDPAALVPKSVFFTGGVGQHRDRLHSFEIALRQAGLAPYNLVTVSSILPPGCAIVDRSEGLLSLLPGQIIFCVLARNNTNDPGTQITSSVGLAVPEDPALHGYISEHQASEEAREVSSQRAELLAADMLATSMGFELDPVTDSDRTVPYGMSDKIVHTEATCFEATGTENGDWTTVVACAAFTL